MLAMNNIKLKPKLVLLFLLVGGAAIASVGWWSSRLASEALFTKAYDQLESIRAIKKSSVERYFSQIEHQILTFSEDIMVVDAMEKFKVLFPQFRQDNNYGPEDVQRMGDELKKYYTTNFTEEFMAQNHYCPVRKHISVACNRY